VADLRRMREELSFVPHYTAEDTLHEFAEWQHAAPFQVGPFSTARDEERLRDQIEQRQRDRSQEAVTGPSAEDGGDHE
jgi:hypothetical protein